MTLSFARRVLTLLPMLTLPALAGCSADASSPDGPGGAEATASELTVPRNFKCLFPDFNGDVPFEGYRSTLISRDAASAPNPTIGSRWTGCPVSLTLNGLQLGAWGGKSVAQLNIGSTPTQGAAYMELSVVATKNVPVFTNGQWTTNVVTERVFSGTVYPVYSQPSFTPPLYFSRRFELPSGYDTLNVSVNAYQTYTVGPRGGPSLPAVNALPVDVALFFQ